MTENTALKTRTYTKLAAFTVALVALFGGGALLGGLGDPGAPGDEDAAPQGHGGPAGVRAPAHVSSGAVVRVASTSPSAGRYRLYLQFQHEGRVHTAAFTQALSR